MSASKHCPVASPTHDRHGSGSPNARSILTPVPGSPGVSPLLTGLL